MIQLKFYCECGKLLEHYSGEDIEVHRNTVEICVKPCKKCQKAVYNRGHTEGEMFRDKVLSGLKPRKVKYEPKQK